MTEWFPIGLRIQLHQIESEYYYKRSRMLRNAGLRKGAERARHAASFSASEGRRLLFMVIDKKLPLNYTGN